MALVALMLFGLQNDPKAIPSPFIGQQAPDFSVPKLYKLDEKITAKEMRGQVWVLNIWASWCPSCQAEHKVLSRLIDLKKVPTIGLNYKDFGTEEYGEDALAWLAKYGNPYQAVAVDTDGGVGLDWGVVGAPETFVVDKKGIVRYKFTGPVYDQAVEQILVPLIDELRKEEG
ncbi:UNVERIFIED_CONTAM: hypothetical protein GTU68_016964 [Idotea baltica]|nr:hypothetical protein [Idotea baltica]